MVSFRVTGDSLQAAPRLSEATSAIHGYAVMKRHPCLAALGGDSAGVGESITWFKRWSLRSTDDPLQMSPSLTGTAPVFAGER